MNTTAPKTPGRDSAGERRDLLAFDRADRVGMTVLLGLVGLGAVVGWLIGPILGWVRGWDLRVPFESAVEIPALAGSGVEHGEGAYDIVVADPSAGQRVLDLMPGFGLLVLTLVGSWLLYRLLRDVGSGDPFQRHNVLRLRVIAGLLVFGYPIVMLVESTTRLAILTGVDLGDLGPQTTFELPMPVMLTGLAVALVAEAFKTGARLRDDVDGLV